MWAQEYNHGLPRLVQIQIAYALATAYDGYILGVHMDGRTLHHNVMQNPTHVHIILLYELTQHSSRGLYYLSFKYICQTCGVFHEYAHYFHSPLPPLNTLSLHVIHTPPKDLTLNLNIG